MYKQQTNHVTSNLILDLKQFISFNITNEITQNYTQPNATKTKPTKYPIRQGKSKGRK